MVARELQISKDETGCAAVVVDNLPDFVEAAARHPRRLVILRAGTAVPPAELRRYCLALGGILEYDQASESRMSGNTSA